MVKSQTIIFEDNVIEILHNTLLSKNPFLVRIYDYHNQPFEIRMNAEELKEMSEFIDSFLSDIRD